MTEKDVVLYTQPGCAGCAREKKWLSSKGVPFTEKDIREDERALRELTELGSRGTPTTVVGGEVVMGVDPETLGEKLEV
jgi:glutaredoxin-like protein NrdH